MTQQSVAKFRPYFTLASLEALNQLIIQHAPVTAAHPGPLYDAHQSISLAIYKARQGLLKPAHHTAPPLLDKLGLETSEETIARSPQKESPEILMARWRSGSHNLTPAELAQVNEYRYLNDLMTPEESVEYEFSLVSSKSP